MVACYAGPTPRASHGSGKHWQASSRPSAPALLPRRYSANSRTRIGRLRILPKRLFGHPRDPGVPAPDRSEGATVEVVYRRPPDDVRRFRQEVLHDGPSCKVSVFHVEEDLNIGDITVGSGGAVLWYLFPGRPFEVAAVHDATGRRLGYYTNFIRTPSIEADRWNLTDLYLDVWQGSGEPARLLDTEDLADAVASGIIESEEAQAVRAEADAVLRAAQNGRWPPRLVRDYPLEDVPALRLRRDDPGTYFANLIVGRLIAFGIYAFGAVSITSLAFAAVTDAFYGSRSGLLAWMAVVAIELVVLFGLSLAGRLPATRRPRREEVVTERILFIGALIAGLAVFVYPDGDMWRGGLLGIYSTLAVFLAVFAAVRFRYERNFPTLAVVGFFVCLVALIVLL